MRATTISATVDGPRCSPAAASHGTNNIIAVAGIDLTHGVHSFGVVAPATGTFSLAQQQRSFGDHHQIRQGRACVTRRNWIRDVQRRQIMSVRVRRSSPRPWRTERPVTGGKFDITFSSSFVARCSPSSISSSARPIRA